MARLEVNKDVIMKSKLRFFLIAVWLLIVAVELFQMRTEGARPLRVTVLVAASLAIVFTLIEWVRESKRTH